MISVRHAGDTPITAETIDRLLAARRLVVRGGATLASTCLRLPGGARLVPQPMPDGEAPAVVVQFSVGWPEWPAVLDARSATVVVRIARSPTVGDAAQGIAREAGTSLEQAWPDVERITRDALLRGALEVSQSADPQRSPTRT